ncbi:MAG: hypothetical protein EOP58_00035 [Sphingomonadales bacterium]|nr:MAG: hypothetical protein EOP58_00035 [Sphingomonadales bacterium]
MTMLAVTVALVVGAIGGYLIQRQRAAAHQSSPELIKAVRAERVNQFALLPQQPHIAMLGDSITHAGEWSELLGEVVANRGIGGDRSAQVLERISTVPASARTVFLMVGINDLSGRIPVAEIADNTQQIVKALQPRQVVVQSVLFTADRALSGPIAELNARNRAYCDTGACRYLELNDLFAHNDLLRDDMTVDGIHLAGRAYPLWGQRIKDIADSAAGARSPHQQP